MHTPYNTSNGAALDSKHHHVVAFAYWDGKKASHNECPFFFIFLLLHGRGTTCLKVPYMLACTSSYTINTPLIIATPMIQTWLWVVIWLDIVQWVYIHLWHYESLVCGTWAPWTNILEICGVAQIFHPNRTPSKLGSFHFHLLSGYDRPPSADFTGTSLL